MEEEEEKEDVPVGIQRFSAVGLGDASDNFEVGSHFWVDDRASFLLLLLLLHLFSLFAHEVSSEGLGGRGLLY